MSDGWVKAGVRSHRGKAELGMIQDVGEAEKTAASSSSSSSSKLPSAADSQTVPADTHKFVKIPMSKYNKACNKDKAKIDDKLDCKKESLKKLFGGRAREPT